MKGEAVMDDKKIIELYFKRDERAVIETEDKYGGYCFAIANNILANTQDSEECVNDTWSRAWNSIPPENPNCFKLFLARITRNLALDKIKVKTRQKRGGGESALIFDEISELISDGETVEKELERKEFMNTVNRFLRNIPQRERGIFISRYFFGESIEVISKKYRITKSNTEKLLSRTRIKLRELLKKEGYTV